MVSGLRSQVSGLRDIYVDSLRGFGIFLVVFAHIFRWFRFSRIIIPSGIAIMEWIYSFHMPLLFMIAGYVHAMKDRYGTQYFSWAKKYLIDIYLPCLYFSLPQWLLMYFIFSVNNPAKFGSTSINGLYTLPFTGFKEYWFLAALFFVKIVHIIFECGVKYKEINTFFWIIIFFACQLISLPAYITQLHYGLYFHIGYILKRREIFTRSQISYALILICAGILFYILPLKYDGVNFFTRAGAALCMSLGLFTLFYAMRITNQFFITYGIYSMVIYCSHVYVVASFRLLYTISGLAYSVNPWILFWICCPFAFSVPLLIVLLYKRVKFLRWVEYIFYPGKLFYKK